ncbi:MAG: glycosyltransferase family 39 protein [Isosphaeraceae bacterium]
MPDRRLVLGLIALAIVVRAAAVLALQSHTVPHSTYEHGEIAENLLAGRGFSIKLLGAEGPTSQQAPVYPLVVAAAYAIGGVGTPGALLWLQLGQAVLGAWLVAGVLALAREVAPDRPRVAYLAGLIAALHPTLVYATTHVQVAPLAAPILVWALFWAYRGGRSGRSRDLMMAGAWLGLLVLTDPILGLIAPGMARAVGKGRGPWGWSARPVLILAATASLVVAPWIVRNGRVHHELVLVKSTFGYAFWQGNCALSEGTDKVVRPSVERALNHSGKGLQGWNEALWAARHEAGCIDDVALTGADYQTMGQLSEPERSRFLFRKALNDLRAEPGRYVQLCLRRLRYFVFIDESNPKTRSLIYRSGHLGLTALALLGLILAEPDVRRRVGPTVLAASLIALFHTLTIVSARFHVPIEPLMALWAASGVTRLGSASPAGDVIGVGVERRLAVGQVGA